MVTLQRVRFPTSDEDSSTPDETLREGHDVSITFPTSDEDSSTPDSCVDTLASNTTLSFRPLTRIHLLLTGCVRDYAVCCVWFPTSDEDSSTPDRQKEYELRALLMCFRPLTRIHLLLTKNNQSNWTAFKLRFRPLTRIHLLLTSFSVSDEQN